MNETLLCRLTIDEIYARVTVTLMLILQMKVRADMKSLMIVIRPEKLEELKELLNKYEVGGMTVSSIMGCGNQKGVVSNLKGLQYNINLIPKIQVNVIVNDDKVEEILLGIHETISSGKVGDGKVFVYPVEEVMRIRTGERGKSAI
jgi:nitrogen regulatory protein P-II 1